MFRRFVSVRVSSVHEELASAAEAYAVVFIYVEHVPHMVGVMLR